MRIKLFLSFFVLVLLFIGLNWATGRYLASLLDQQIREMTHPDNSLEYRSIRINPAFGSLTIKQIAFRDQEYFFHADELRGSLTYADIWRVFRHGSEDPLGNIHTFRIRTESLELQEVSIATNADSPDDRIDLSASVTIESLNLIYNGRLNELLDMLQSDQPPVHNHRINLRLGKIITKEGFHDYLDGLPVLSGYRFPDTFDQISLQIRYYGPQKTATLSTFRILSPGLTFRAGGEIRYGDNGWPSHPESYKLNYQFNAATHELARIPLSPELGGFSMDSLSVSSNVEFDHTSETRHPFALPGVTNLYMGDIHWYPSPELTEQYGLIFGMFGLSEQKLPIRSIQAEYQILRDTLHIDDATLTTDPFDAQIYAKVATPAGYRPDILEGSVTFIRTGADFNDFIDGIEGLFRIELPRKNGQLYFEFSGDPQNPDVDLSL